MMFNQTHYGITRDAMRCARWTLTIGWTWEQVMKDLQVTYEARKAYFEKVNQYA